MKKYPKGTFIINAHDIGKGRDGDLRRIERNIDKLEKLGFLCSINEALSDLNQKSKTRVAFTFDDGFEGALFIAEKLSERGIAALFFITSGVYGDSRDSLYLNKFNKRYITLEEAGYIKSLGHYLGNHGDRHINYSCESEEECLNDFRSSNCFFNNLKIIETDYFAFPFGVASVSIEEQIRRENPNITLFFSNLIGSKQNSRLSINRRHWELYESLNFLKYYLAFWYD